MNRKEREARKDFFFATLASFAVKSFRSNY
jgi:hypothetical protein